MQKVLAGNQSAFVIGVSCIGQGNMWVVWCLGSLVGLCTLLSLVESPAAGRGTRGQRRR